ncbi:MAG TPA: isochorismate synthase [Leptolyngbyaceae cyanobacterium]
MYVYTRSSSKYQIQLAKKIKRFFSINSHRSINNQAVRIEVKIDNHIQPLQWLHQQKSISKIYWSDRENQFEIAGVGEADVEFGDKTIEYSQLFAKLNSRLSSSYKNLRYYGGISFKQTSKKEQSWQHFGNYRFVLPKFEVYSENNETYLSCNFLLKDSLDHHLQLTQLLLELESLVFNQASHPISLPMLLSRKDFPNASEWQRNIQAALTSFTQGKTTKIVLARKSIFEFSEEIEPLSLLLFLKKSNPNLFHFCFQPSCSNAFIGASPERLYKRVERLLLTEAVAGTRPRSNSLVKDKYLSQELLTSEKDIREHRLVVDTIRGVFHHLCHSLETGKEPVILKLKKVQHLYTSCQGVLLDKFSDADILPKLHPTPAVGGYPKEEALIAINELETFDRGWYAAPVGWIGHNSAEFAVAIRSGLVENNRLSLFSGAGLVQGSKPEDEWQEIENKLGSFLEIIGHATIPTNVVLSA